MLHFYDFECFKYDWLVVFINPINKTKEVIVNDKDKLQEYYDKFKDEIFIGFNSRGYDQFIFKGILCDFDPYKITDFIINKGKNGYQFSRIFSQMQLYNYDVYKGVTDYGLKTLECFMGNNIKETSVPFNLDRKLTQSEINETIKYCTHDVEQLIEVFLLRKDEFDTHLSMIKEFKLPLSNINKTTAQLNAVIMNAQKPNRKRDDDYDFYLPDTLKLSKYKYIADWFMSSYQEACNDFENAIEEAREILKSKQGSKKKLADAKKLIDGYTYELDKTFAKFFYSRNLTTDVAGVEHTYAWGGVHAAIPKFNYICKDDEIMIMADVTSLYPSLDIQYDLQSRNVSDKSIFEHIYNMNIELKKLKDPRRPIYKLICNTTYGCKGDEYNNLYDKRNQNLTCIFGQVLLTDLIEKLELGVPSFKLIQSNTDGILILIKRKDFDKVDDIVYEWETRTRLGMEFTFAKRIYQKDVNNYVMVTYDGHIKSKGAYVKELSKLDYDLPIVNKAMVEYMVNDTPIEKTINECKELIMFQKVFKLSGKYARVWHNNKFMTDKCYRVFASKNTHDTYLGKQKSEGATIERFANTPEHCFIYNDSIVGIETPEELDRSFYIELTRERLRQFGVLK